jgi:hypothetical protein
VRQASSTVQASIRLVGPELGVLTPQGPLGDVNQFAQLAQQARDSIDNVKADFATSNPGGDLGQAEAEASTGTNDLENAMAALVAYTEHPSSATLTQFASQYQSARSEWNGGIRTIWRIAGYSDPPAV